MEEDGVTRVYVQTPDNAYIPFGMWEMFPDPIMDYTERLNEEAAQEVLGRSDARVTSLHRKAKTSSGFRNLEPQIEFHPENSETFVIDESELTVDGSTHKAVATVLEERLGKTGLTIVWDAETDYGIVDE
jgi:hypothetical protein